MPADFIRLYKRYGPLLYSHFFRLFNEENKATKATRYAFAELLKTDLRDDVSVVRWVRTLEFPTEAAQTESLW